MNPIEKNKKISKILFRNAQVLDPESHKQRSADVLVEDGLLRHVGKVDAQGFDGEIFDVAGRLLCPGLIDMHVHLREPGREDEETIESGCAAAMAGGFTGVCPMPNTEPATDNAEVVSYIVNRARDLLVDVFPVAAVTMGRKGDDLTEVGDLVAAGAVAFSDDGDPVSNADRMRRALEYTRMFDVPVINHCEDKELSKNGVMHEGAVSTRLGLPGIPGLSEDVMVARDIQIAQFTGGKLHIAHISTANSVALVREAKRKGIRVTCEVMPHHFVLTDAAVESYDSDFKMNPPLRTTADVEAMLDGLKDGSIDVIASDHAPHSIEEKQTEFSAAPFGIVGLETALGIVIKHLVEPGVLSLSQAMSKMTLAPAEILKLDRGRLKIGSAASITIFDPEREWTVDKREFKSKSMNTPFDAWVLKGQVVALYNKGRFWLNK